MKKCIKFIALFALFLLPIKVNASTASLSLSCPATAASGSVVNCSINTSNSGDINGFTAKFSFSGGVSYSDMAFAGGYDLSLQTKNASGFQMGVTDKLTANGTIATLSVKIPDGAASGSKHTIALTDVEASNLDYDDVVGTGNSQTITVVSSNNYLSSLSITGANLGFNKNTGTYTVKINAATATISATAEDGKSTITGTGTVSIKEGKNTFNIMVTAESGAKRTYTIVVNRPRQNTGTTPQPQPEPEPEPEQPAEDTPLPEIPGSEGLHAIEGPNADKKDKNNKLKSLIIDKVKVPFNSEINEYELYVGYEVEEVKVTAKAASKKAKVDGNTSHKLIVGRNVLRVTVTAESGATRIYEVIITRDPEEKVTKANKLKSITVDGVELNFKKDKKEYKILTSQKSLNVNVELENKNSTYVIKGNHDLVNGSEVRIKVTDKEGNINVYTIKINMPPNAKKASKSCNIGLVIVLCVLFLLIGGGAGFGACYYLYVIKKTKVEELPEDEFEVLELYDREDETAPEILTMTAEIQPVAEPVYKDKNK